ncbi:MAG: ABC transporter ATP-binding protein [Holophagales bacterium]|nr:ABC transporter ATP-binding protein [Holophagales bacterium]
MLEVKNVKVGYQSSRSGSHVVAGPISTQLRPGELVCLVGPNGAGKSTLMRTLAGMQPALGGEVLLDGSNVHRLSSRERARRLSVVLTGTVSTGLLDVEAVVGLGRYPHTGWSGRLGAEDHRVVRWALAAVGIEDFAYRLVSELSDGERQKVMIARALAQEPTVMVLDEITAFLDLPRRVQMMQLLRRLARTSDRAILLSTHDLDLALRSADRIWLMQKDEPLAVGAPEDLVLRGDFEKVFVREGVHFDREHGSFRIHHKLGAEIRLIGEGIEAVWTARALEREGFDVAAGEGTEESPVAHGVPRVEVMRDGSRARWKLTDTEGSRESHSLYELTRDLRSLLVSRVSDPPQDPSRSHTSTEN